MFTMYTEVIDWLLRVPALDQAHALRNLAQVRTLTQLPTLQPNCPIITITGTNGKGSAVQTLSAIFSQAGYRVGSFTSPHLQIFNERIAINGHAIADHDFVQAAQVVANLPDVPRHFFSLLFLMALWYFKRQSVDLIILEVGLGGRLDPCNALDATILGITSVDLDHTHLLGTTREQIAAEKACLMRPDRVCIVGDRNPPDVLSAYAAKMNTSLRCIGVDFDYYDANQTTLTWQGSEWYLTALTKPAVKLSNIAVALAIVEALHPVLPLSLAALSGALASLTIPGRYQKITCLGKTLLLDVAHNPAATGHLVRQLRKDFPGKRIHLLFGMMQDKDWRSCFDSLSTLNIRHAYFPNIDDPRALDNTVLSSAALSKNRNHAVYSTINEALAAALNNATEQELIIVTGSFRIVGGVLGA